MLKAFRITHWTPILFGMTLVAILSVGCKKEKALTSAQQPTFSTDTIIFDTVFTTVGSVTELFKVYNPHKGHMTIDQIYLEAGDASNYRLNVNGDPGRAFTGVEVPAEDSLFIFVEVTVDPNSATTPLIVTDRVVFETQGKKQYVELVAWGQDAHFFRPTSGNAFVLPCATTLATDKPNVFYGFAIVDEGCALNIPAGAKLHFHPGSGIIVYKGQLNVTGTATNKVVLQGDRLEFDYRDVSGQWEGIRMVQPQTSNITHAVIKNGFYGVWVDTTFSSGHTVTIQKTEISNMASLGIYGNAGARINATNCLVSDCGLYGLALTYGGVFNFNHCTFANYWSAESRSTPTFYFKNWFLNPDGLTKNIRDVDVTMDNCIVYGNIDFEFDTDLEAGAVLNYVFRNCFIKTTSEEDVSSTTHYDSISLNVDPGFEDVSNKKFKLLSSSLCRGAANTNGGITDDIDDKARDGSPDVGCYEY